MRAFLEKWKNSQILYRGFRAHASLNDYFFLLYMGRIAFPMLVASTLFVLPILQAIVYVLFSLVVLGFIIYKKPVNRKINHIQLIIIETVVLVINIALLGLCIIDVKESFVRSHSAFVALGDIVVYGNIVINLLAVVFLIIKVVEGASAIRKYQKANPTGKNGSLWLQLFVFYMQQAGMGFEEMFIDEKTAEIFNQRQYLIDEDKRLLEHERQRLFTAKKTQILAANDEDSPLAARNSKRVSTFLKRTTIIEPVEEQEVEEVKKSPELIIKPQKIEMDGKHKLINETSFAQSPGYTFLNDEQQTSPGAGSRQRIRNVINSKWNLDSPTVGLDMDSRPGSSRLMLNKVGSNESPTRNSYGRVDLSYDSVNHDHQNQNSFILRNIKKHNISNHSKFDNN